MILISMWYEWKPNKQPTNHSPSKHLLNLDSVGNNTADGVGMCTALEVTEEETHEIGVHALITADELVQEGKTSVMERAEYFVNKY